MEKIKTQKKIKIVFQELLYLLGVMFISMMFTTNDSHAYRTEPRQGSPGCYIYYFTREELDARDYYLTNGRIMCFSENHVRELYRVGIAYNILGDIFKIEPSKKSEAKVNRIPSDFLCKQKQEENRRLAEVRQAKADVVANERISAAYDRILEFNRRSAEAEVKVEPKPQARKVKLETNVPPVRLQNDDLERYQAAQRAQVLRMKVDFRNQADQVRESFDAQYIAAVQSLNSYVSDGLEAERPQVSIEEELRRNAPIGIIAALCFPGDTPICVTAEHSKPIQDIQVGDYVQSCNLKAGNLFCERRPVLHVIRTSTDHLIELSFGGRTLRATDNHPFYVADRKEWVEADQLRPGDELLTVSGDTAVVDQISGVLGHFDVFNLDVEGNHNYYASGVLVHNCTVAVGTIGAGTLGTFMVGAGATAYIGKVIYDFATSALSEKSNGDSTEQEVKPKSTNQMQKEVDRGQAPKSIERVDKGVDRPGLKEKPHIHLEDGSALNNDGTWKHGGRTLTEAEKKWILKSGWKLPQ